MLPAIIMTLCLLTKVYIIQVPERTALMIARDKGHAGIVDMLIEAGAKDDKRKRARREGVSETDSNRYFCVIN